MRVCGVYKLTNTVTGKSYVGSSVSVRERITNHLVGGVASGVASDIKEFGRHVFTWEILEECPEDMLEKRELHWINKLDTVAPSGLNRASYANRGRPTLPDGKRRIRIDVRLSQETLDQLDAIADMYETTRTGAIEIAAEWTAEASGPVSKRHPSKI